MLVFWKEKLAFLSVPKTGTTAYHTALAPHASLVVNDPPELKHAPLYRYNRFFRPMFEKTGGGDIETIAVVREPISWLGSWYRYRRRPFMVGQRNSTHEVTFDEFVEAYMLGKSPSFANVGSQARFLEPRPNGLTVTHLFRYEEQAKLDQFLKQRLSVSFSLEKENVSPEIPLSLSPSVERKLRNKCADEFTLWEGATS
ncbi:gamma-glutamyl kinase [Thalassobius vesicularis]|uniref:Gamma-glutamyl kinase n=1 Tax=Thalassobius vesicularis TaxID=1294297 RepID=A0A4S3MA45_9RHOB|nr:sulfotransferase family protein [Thalassobius vesicularis]THD74950.1 gamma-glutamyl kinase [Thalassobius vesicularis]